MVCEPAVDKASGGIDLFLVLLPASLSLMMGIIPRRSASQKGQV